MVAEGEGVVEISKAISAAATFYEKVRYLIDYREEHTIRRAAIERILKRRILIEKRMIAGEALLQELVEGQYLPGASASEMWVAEIDRIIAHFMQLQVLSGRTKHLAKLLISFAASEIESLFSAREHVIDSASVDAFYQTIRKHVIVPGFAEEHIDVQTYCACRRALLASDDAALSYALWLMYVPDWKRGETDLESLAGNLKAITNTIHVAVEDQLHWQIVQRIKNESIYFRIVRELLIQKTGEAESILMDSAKMDAFTKDFLEKKYERENERIKSSGVRAVAYLFFTKMIVALSIEAPYEYFFVGAVAYPQLITNIIFHPALLFALTRRVKALGESNTNAIIKGLHGVLYQGTVRSIRVYARYTNFTRLFAAMYVVLFFGVFGAIITILQAFQFNIVGTTLFLFFLALVSYFAYRIRRNASRWKVSGGESAASLIVNVLAVPVVRAGRWLSRTFSTINVFVLIMDFIIESPFRLLLNFSHQFIVYLREKADEVY
ncbi:hypothetical protein HY968_02420 [Candidatus Kaiserbacteria bacterium]|nr:hypothetical protein [Candidatus Kaiserbacteria bacterium]